MPGTDNTVTIEGARLIFRNFKGVEQKYNREGDRNFSVILDDGPAEQMQSDGWNVKWLKPREDDEDQHSQAYLPVKVNFKGKPQRIVLITSRGRQNLGEQEVELLDWADIQNVDLIVRPYEWDVNGRQGISAYLQSIYVTINEDELELKYGRMEDDARAEPQE